MFITALVALIASSFLHSSAKDSIAAVSSPMTEPIPSIVAGSGYNIVTVYYVTQWNTSYSSVRYKLYELICHTSPGSVLTFRIGRQNVGLYSSGQGINPYIVNQYDISDGTLLTSQERTYTPATWENNLSLYQFVSSYFPENSASSDICAGGYPILPSGVSVSGSTNSVYNSDPFVTWSLKPPEHNVFHSHLSEPVSDKYNRYFILDDKLYWVSLRLNGFYVESTDITGHAESFTESEFVPQPGGYENGYQQVLVPYTAWIADHQEYQSYFDQLPFSLILIPDPDQWKIAFKSSDIFSGLATRIDCDFFISEFNLSDGTYITSSFTSFQRDNLSTAQYALFESGSFSSIKCYGIDFYNALNLPINLSDVIFEYDLEFEQWKTDVLSYLQQIYNLLAGTDNPPPDQENTYPDFGGSLNEAESGYTDITPENVALELQGALGAGSYDSAASQVRDWINLFSIPKIISVCVLALALGTVTLTLGKKKSD